MSRRHSPAHQAASCLNHTCNHVRLIREQNVLFDPGVTNPMYANAMSLTSPAPPAASLLNTSSYSLATYRSLVYSATSCPGPCFLLLLRAYLSFSTSANPFPSYLGDDVPFSMTCLLFSFRHVCLLGYTRPSITSVYMTTAGFPLLGDATNMLRLDC
jgi:hypothetical protein